jgi:hypothetical protein
MIPKKQNVPNGNNISKMPINDAKWLYNIATFSNLRPSKIYPNWDTFGYKINHLATHVQGDAGHPG